MIRRFSIHWGLSSALVCINTCSSGLILSYQQSTPIVTACVQYSFLQLKKAILLSLKENTLTHTHALRWFHYLLGRNLLWWTLIWAKQPFVGLYLFAPLRTSLFCCLLWRSPLTREILNDLIVKQILPTIQVFMISLKGVKNEWPLRTCRCTLLTFIFISDSFVFTVRFNLSKKLLICGIRSPRDLL